MRKYLLAAYHIRLTVLLLALGLAIAVYFQMETWKGYLVGAFMALVTHYVDKLRDIEKTEKLDKVEKRGEVETKVRKQIDWKAIFSRLGKPVMILLYVAAFTIMLLYAYIIFVFSPNR